MAFYFFRLCSWDSVNSLHTCKQTEISLKAVIHGYMKS